MLASAPSQLRFEAFTLDTARCVLMRDGSEVPLRRQSFDVLHYLALHVGKVVSTEELVQAVWVSKPADHSASVGQCIKEIRRALGDDARWIIKTVSGRGYAFKAGVSSPDPSSPVVGGVATEPSSVGLHPLGQEGTARNSDRAQEVILSTRSPWQRMVFATVALALALSACIWWLRPGPWAPPSDTVAMMAEPTIAILPFEALGPTNVERVDASGLAEELRTAFARAHRGFGLVIKLPAESADRVSVSKKEGRWLGVRYAMLGTTRLDRDGEHANIQLIDLETETQIWSESFEARLDGPGAMERLAARIARLAAFHVCVAESRRPLPERPESGHFVIMGRALLDSERGSKGTRDALKHFERALSLDPNSTFALHGLAAVKIDQVRNGWLPWEQRQVALREAESAISRIIKLDHRNVGAHWLRGFLLRERGDVDHAIAALEHALSLNPNYSLALAELGRAKIDVGKTSEGLQHIMEAIRVSPTDPSIHVRYFWAGLAAVHRGDDQAAVTWLLKARQANRAYAITMQWLAVAYLGAGDEKKARALIAEYLDVSPGFSIASWRRSMASHNPVVKEQRRRIEDALRRLGVPEGTSLAAEL